MQLTIVDNTAQYPLIAALKDALMRSMAGDGKLSSEVATMDGFSGKKYRLFINNLISSVPDARYLEIGVWQGSTLCSAIYENSVRALAIDNWTEFGGPADRFFSNLGRFKGEAAHVSFLDRNFREIDFSSVGRYNIYLFDGPHEAADHRDGVVMVQPALDDHYVSIVDDWNWEQVRTGTLEGIRNAAVNLDYAVEIRTTLDNTHPAPSGPESDWHNGYFIAACSKAASRPARSANPRAPDSQFSIRDLSIFRMIRQSRRLGSSWRIRRG